MAQERPWARGHFYVNTLVRLGRRKFCPRFLTRGLPLSRVRNPVSTPPPAATQRLSLRNTPGEALPVREQWEGPKGSPGEHLGQSWSWPPGHRLL